MKIKNKLTLLFFLLVIIILGLGFYAVHFVVNSFENHIVGNMQLVADNTLREININLSHRIDQIKAYSFDLALEPELINSNKKFSSMTLDERKSYIASKEKLWSIENNRKNSVKKIVNNDLSKEISNEFELKQYYKKNYGEEVFADTLVTNKFGVNVAMTGKTTSYCHVNEKWWKSAKKDGVYISNIKFDKATGDHLINICTRIDNADNNFIGVFSVSVNINENISFIKTIKNNSPYKTMSIELFTRDGNLIYKTTSDYKFLSHVHEFDIFRTQNHSLKKIIKSDSSGYYLEYLRITEAGENEELIVCSHLKDNENSKGLGWNVILEYETSEIFAPVFVLRNILLVIILIAVLLALAIGIFVVRNVAVPIEKIKKATHRVSSGDYGTVIDIQTNDEIGQLAATFNKMSAHLKQTIETEKELAKIEAVAKSEKKNIEKLQSVNKELLLTLNKLADEMAYNEGILKSMADGLWVINEEGNTIDCNPSMIKMLGYDNKNDFLKLKPADVTPPEYLKRTVQQISGALAGKNIATVLDLFKKDRSRIPISIIASPVWNSNGHVTGALAIMRDMTEMIKTEKKLIRLNKEIEKANRHALFMLAVASEYKDNDTGDHINRIRKLVTRIALRVGLKHVEARHMGLDSILHDLGKISIPDAILTKPGKLTKDEFEEMKQHTLKGAAIIGDDDWFKQARIIALYHHEKWDGSGYPEGLKGKNIPLAARIVAVADVFDALISKRVYKEAWTLSKAVEEIKAQSGKHFDPEIVDVFIGLYKKGQFK